VKIVAIGEILWDVFPDGERLGGAPLNFAAHAARLGHEVILVSAVGDDPRGYQALREMKRLGLTTDWIRTVFDMPTGEVTVRLDEAGQPHFTIHRPAAYDRVALDQGTLGRLAAARPDWIAFGTLHQMEETVRAATRAIFEACGSARRFYDVNLRPGSYTPELVKELLAAADAVKLSEAEAAEVAAMAGLESGSPEAFCAAGAERFGWKAACVTRGAAGSVVWIEGRAAEAQGYRVEVADAVGAGDAYAAAFLHGLEAGWPAAQVADFANRVGALVASRPGAIPKWSLEELEQLGR